MTKHAYQQSVFSGSDTVAVAPFAQITVTNASDDSAASIWSDAAGANPIADGVLLADENGYFIFYADKGTYNIAILSDGISKTLENVEIGAGNPYSGQFRGTWDMSSGSTGPAAPLNDYQATHTGTTITPDPHLVSPYYVKLSAAYSDPIQLQSSGTAQASIVVPDYTVGDNLMYVIMAVTNSSATAEDLEASIDGSQPANPIWTSFLLINPAYQQFILGHNNNDDYTSGVDTGGAINSGDTAYMDFDFSTGNINVVVNGTTYGPSHLDLSGFPPGDGIKLFAGMVFSAANTVFAAGNISVNFSDTTGGGTGFSIAHDATLPTGALDNDWYEVSAGGYFHGKTTRAGQFVKLIRGKTDLIVVDKPADQGTSTVEAVTVTHFSDINTTGVTDPRLYVVTADETNANQRTQYLFDGSALMWLVALEA